MSSLSTPTPDWHKNINYDVDRSIPITESGVGLLLVGLTVIVHGDDENDYDVDDDGENDTVAACLARVCVGTGKKHELSEKPS